MTSAISRTYFDHVSVGLICISLHTGIFFNCLDLFKLSLMGEILLVVALLLYFIQEGWEWLWGIYLRILCTLCQNLLRPQLLIPTEIMIWFSNDFFFMYIYHFGDKIEMVLFIIYFYCVSYGLQKISRIFLLNNIMYNYVIKLYNFLSYYFCL